MSGRINGDMSLVMALAAASMMSRRAKRPQAEPAPDTAEKPAQTATISQAEQEEIDRCPRAYRRRMMKRLRKEGKL